MTESNSAQNLPHQRVSESTETDGSTWSAPPAAQPASASSTHGLSLEQQLELVDRVKALEAQLAQVSRLRSLTPTEQLDAEQLVVELRSSLPWRVGRIITIPLRIIQRTARRTQGR